MKSYSLALFVLPAALLCGCVAAHYEDDKPDTMPLAQTADPADPLPQDALPGWGEAAGSSRLDAWIVKAMTAAPSLRSAEYAVRVENARTRAAGTGRRPEVTVEADLRTGSTLSIMTDGEERDVHQFAGRAMAAWDLDVFGKVRSAVGAARFAELSASHQLDDMKTVFAADTANTYVLGQLWNELLRIRIKAVEAYEAVAEYTDSRVKAGLAAPAERQMLEMPLQSAKQQQVATRQKLAELEAKWSYLMSSSGAPALKDIGTLSPAAPVPPPDEGHLHAYAVNRPDVKAAHAFWRNAVLMSQAADRGRLPTVSAVAAAESEAPSPLKDPEAWTTWAGVRLSLPLLSPDLKAKSEEAMESAHLQKAMFDDTAALALQDLREAYASRINSEEAWKSSQAAAQKLKMRFESATRQFEEGRFSVPELEEARLLWLKAAEEELTSYAELLMTRINLLRACGGTRRDPASE